LGYGLENSIPHDISHIHMIIVQPQLGVIAWDSPHSRFPIDRLELMSEGILGNAFRPGGSLIGDSLFLRFGLKPTGHAVPFFDIGSGLLHTTLNKNANEVTGHTQFLSQAGVGLQYFIRPQQAVVIEYRYFHMSNGGLQRPNPGFNGSMLSIGFCWLHPPPLLGASVGHLFFHFPHFPRSLKKMPSSLD
jgi:Lipid A 3-O-deacylase (PagL)